MSSETEELSICWILTAAAFLYFWLVKVFCSDFKRFADILYSLKYHGKYRFLRLKKQTYIFNLHSSDSWCSKRKDPDPNSLDVFSNGMSIVMASFVCVKFRARLLNENASEKDYVCTTRACFPEWMGTNICKYILTSEASVQYTYIVKHL